MNKPTNVFHSKKDNKKMIQISTFFVIVYVLLLSSLFYKLYPSNFFIFLSCLIVFVGIVYYVFFLLIHPKITFYEEGIRFNQIFSKDILYKDIVEFFLYNEKDIDFIYIRSNNKKMNINLSSEHFPLEEIKAILEKKIKK